MRNFDVDKLLELQDNSDVKSPGLLMYTKDMPAAILSNISTPLGIVVSLSDLNGKPDKLLVQEDDRIAQLARSTEIAWDQIEATDDFRYGRANRM